MEHLHSFGGTTCFLSVKSLTNFNTQKFASIIKPREIGEPPSTTYTLIYNPPWARSSWSIVSPIYVRWGGILLYTIFGFVPVFLLLWRTSSSVCKKTFFGTEVWVLKFRIVLFRTLILYTGFIFSATSVESGFYWHLLPWYP